MQNVHDVVVAVIAFIVLVGLMVVVHEFGHFAVAKLFRIRVEAFSIGFGPRLFGVKYGDTDYRVCLFPLGGYVKMTGENPGEESDIAKEEDPDSFTAHPRWERMLIGLAGPVSNFILAFVLMVFYFAFLNEVPALKTTSIEWVSDGSPAAQAGLLPGDTIQRFGSISDPNFIQIRALARRSPGQTVPVVVQRAGSTVSVDLHLPTVPPGQNSDISKLGIFVQFLQTPIDVDSITAGSPAEKAGLKGGDQIVAVDGHAFHTLEPLIDYLQAGKGKPVTLSVRRGGGAPFTLLIQPNQDGSQWRLGFGYAPPEDIPVRREPMQFGESIAESKDFCVENSSLILDVLGRIFTHKVAVSQLSGPIGIARMAGQAAEMKDMMPKFGLAAAISLNLGILNLMPFPILDGGLILLLIIESLIRHDINMMVKERIYQAAFVVLIALFAFIMFNDVTKLPIFTHLKP
jgi:regulator of sigma E protease